MAASSSFRDWVRGRGVRATARDLGVSRTAVQKWLRGGSPRLRLLSAVVDLAQKEGVTLSREEVLTPT